MYKQIFIKSKSRNGKIGQTELTGRRALRRGGSALDCRAIEEGEEEVETVIAIQSKCMRQTAESLFAAT